MSSDNDGVQPNEPRKPSGRASKPPSPYAKRPYRVGKGKPPVEHQFPKGGPSPNPKGRPKGSTRANSLDKLLATKVVVGHKNGRAIKKELGEVIDHKLVERAAKGELDAIKLIKDIQFRYEKAGLTGQLSADEIIRQRDEQLEKEAHSAAIHKSIIAHLETVTHMKKLGVIEFTNGREHIAKWILDELAARRAAHRASILESKP